MKGIDLVQRLHEIWNGDLELIDSVYAPDFVAHWPASLEIPERRGIDGMRSGLTRTRMAFPDWHERVLDVFGSAEMVASRYVSTGTHRGIYRGIEPIDRDGHLLAHPVDRNLDACRRSSPSPTYKRGQNDGR
jgi:hypothetical protein